MAVLWFGQFYLVDTNELLTFKMNSVKYNAVENASDYFYNFQMNVFNVPCIPKVYHKILPMTMMMEYGWMGLFVMQKTNKYK